jgi:hypothetical protein
MHKYLLSYLLFALSFLTGGCAVNPVTGQQDLVCQNRKRSHWDGKPTSRFLSNILYMMTLHYKPTYKMSVKNLPQKVTAVI